MKFLITGASGFVGEELVNFLQKNPAYKTCIYALDFIYTHIFCDGLEVQKHVNILFISKPKKYPLKSPQSEEKKQIQ